MVKEGRKQQWKINNIYSCFLEFLSTEANLSQIHQIVQFYQIMFPETSIAMALKKFLLSAIRYRKTKINKEHLNNIFFNISRSVIKKHKGI